MIKIKCEICKIDFLVPASHAKRRRFCSIKCKGIFQKGKPFFDSTGIPSWNKGKKRKRVECPHCGKVGGNGLMQRWHFDNCKHK